MQTGSFGSIVFQSSSGLVKTWQNFSRHHKAAFATHDVAEGKQKLEFTGVDLREVGFKVRLDAQYVSPESEISALAEQLDSGEPQILIVGGTPLGEYVLLDMREERRYTDGYGRVTVALLDLKFKEYN